MNKTALNIAIIPSDEVIIQVIEMSKKIAEEIGSEFVLNQENLIPHITIYQALYPNKNIDKLRNIAKELSFGQELLEIQLDSIVISHQTFLFWKCSQNKTLQGLHEKAVKLANPLREGLIPSSLSNIKEFSEEDRHDIKMFGSLLIGPHYDPHITIT